MYSLSVDERSVEEKILSEADYYLRYAQLDNTACVRFWTTKTCFFNTGKKGHFYLLKLSAFS